VGDEIKRFSAIEIVDVRTRAETFGRQSESRKKALVRGQEQAIIDGPLQLVENTRSGRVLPLDFGSQLSGASDSFRQLRVSSDQGDSAGDQSAEQPGDQSAEPCSPAPCGANRRRQHS